MVQLFPESFIPLSFIGKGAELVKELFFLFQCCQTIWIHRNSHNAEKKWELCIHIMNIVHVDFQKLQFFNSDRN